MNKKRRIVIALLVAGILGVVIGVLALLPARPGVTKANFDRIENGMTRAQVDALFGGPGELARARGGMWDGMDGMAWVFFDEDHRVIDKRWDDFPDDRTLWETMLDWLPWRERTPRCKIDIL